MSSYVLSCCSTADLSAEHLQERDIHYICFHFSLYGKEYADDLGKSISFEDFYKAMAEGAETKTSQVNAEEYIEYFESFLQQGKDILHVSLSSGISGACNSAKIAKETLEEKYPERKLVVIDSLCSSSGYGLLVDAAADMRDAGKSLDETAEWVTANCNKVHHQFYSTELKFYRRSGRMSGATATIATILDICPIMRLDDKGKIIAYGKVRGKKNAVKETIRTMEQHAQGGVNYSGKCFICHSNCPAEAEATRQAVAEHFPHIQGDIRVNEIGTIIASHCGPGTVAVFFFGAERQPDTSGK